MRSIFIALAAALVSWSAHAVRISPEAALERATQSNGPSKARSVKTGNLRLVDTHNQNIYVFTSDNSGYIIAPADDRVRPVLGYADSGSIDPNNMPPALQWWLGQYDEQIAAGLVEVVVEPVGAKAIVADTETKSAITDNYAKWQPISPLVKTQWNQSAPYNDMCPLDPTQSNRRSVTGCVATAMAQVVYYNKYFKGAGTVSYQPFGSAYQTLSYDYSTANIDFGAMKTTYTSSESGTAAANAVANLMLACGVSVNMGYHASASGAVTREVANALINNFGYSAVGTQFISRSSMSTDQFESTIYNELANGRPMCYSGNTGTGGHCFVCDGYLSDGLFHFNWGWGGTSDGYYAINALNPGEQGIGSSEGGYNFLQGIVTAAIPGSLNVVEDCYRASMEATSDNKVKMTTYCGSQHNGETVYTGFLFRGPYNLDQSWGYTTSSAGSALYWTPTTFTTTYWPAGEYKIYAAYRYSTSEPWQIAEPMAGKSNYVKMVVNDDYTNVISSDNIKETRISDVSPTTFYAEKSTTISFTASNTGNVEINETYGIALTDESGTMTRYNVNGSKVSSTYAYFSYDAAIPVDQSRRIGVTLPAKALSPGKYKMQFMGSNYIPLSPDVVELEVLAGVPSGEVSLPGNWIVYNESEIKSTWINGEEWAHPRVYSINASASSEYTSFHIKFYDANTDNVRATWTSQYAYGLRAANTLYNIAAIGSFNVNLPVGLYDVQYFIAGTASSYNYNAYPASQRVRISVCEKWNDYTVGPNPSGTGAMIIGAPTGDVVIPESMNLSNGTMIVTELGEGLYRYNKDLTSLQIPASVTKIGAMALEGCTSLKYVVMNGETSPVSFIQAVAPNANPNCAWYAPNGKYDAYAESFAGHLLYEKPSAMNDSEIRIDVGETVATDVTFDTPGHYNFTVTSSKATVAYGDNMLNVTGTTAGNAVLTVATPQPFAATATLNVSVITPEIRTLSSLKHLWQNRTSDVLLPTGRKGELRGQRKYVLTPELHVYSHQPNNTIVNEHEYIDGRFYGFKLTGLDEDFNVANTFTANGRLVAKDGAIALQVSDVVPGSTPAEKFATHFPKGTFSPAMCAEWIHTPLKLWCVNYDAATQSLTGFGKTNAQQRAIAADGSAIPVKNINNIILPATSDMYNPEGYIDTDADGSYYFVPVGGFDSPSTGVEDIVSDDNSVANTYFTANGIQINGNPSQPGVYIRLSNGQATKVLIK